MDEPRSVTPTRTCNACKTHFTPRRSDARYCSGRCRTAAHRSRHTPGDVKRKRRPLRESFRDKTVDLLRLAGQLDRMTHDDRFTPDVGAGMRNEIRFTVEHLTRVLAAIDGD